MGAGGGVGVLEAEYVGAVNVSGSHESGGELGCESGVGCSGSGAPGGMIGESDELMISCLHR